MKNVLIPLILLGISFGTLQSAYATTAQTKQKLDKSLERCVAKSQYRADENVCLGENLATYQKILKKQKYYNKTLNQNALSKCEKMETVSGGFGAIGEIYECQIEATKAQLK